MKIPLSIFSLLFVLGSILGCLQEQTSAADVATEQTPACSLSVESEAEKSVVVESVAAEPVVCQKADKWDLADSYVLYYGRVDESTLETLATYDIVVVDPQAMGGDVVSSVKKLHDKGCVVIGYLSYFEVATWHKHFSKVPQEWYVKVDGKNWIPWGSNVCANLMEPKWRAILVEETKAQILDLGFDGVFMDTIADLDNPALPADQKKEQLEGLRALMSELRAAYPKAKFIGNWTIQDTLKVMAEWADAICWEDFAPMHYREGSQSRAWILGNRDRIVAARDKYGFKVLTLWNEDNPGANSSDEQSFMRSFSRENGFIPYACTGGYGSTPKSNPSEK